MKILVPGIGDCLPFYLEGTVEEFAALILKGMEKERAAESKVEKCQCYTPQGEWGMANEWGHCKLCNRLLRDPLA